MQQQGRGHTGAEERPCEWTRNMQWQVASAMNVKFSFLIELLLTVLPLLARRDSSSFVVVHFCSSPSRHGVRSVHCEWTFSGRWYRKEFARCLQSYNVGLERTSLKQYFSSYAFSWRTGQSLRGRSSCRRHSSMALCDTGVPEGVPTMSPKA